jgi:2-phosphoglycerate kinase
MAAPSAAPGPAGELPNVVFCYIIDGAAAAGPAAADDDDDDPAAAAGVRYTRALLRRALRIAGCRDRRAARAADRAFAILRERAGLAPAAPLSLARSLRALRPGAAAVALPRAAFEALVAACAAAAGAPPPPPPELRAAAALAEGRAAVAVLLCGTSGTGKSTLASLLAGRLGVTAVVSTDSIRHALRSFAPPADAPLLWASTYTAGAALARARAAAGAGAGAAGGAGLADEGADQTMGSRPTDAAAAAAALRDTLAGYAAQSAEVAPHVATLLARLPGGAAPRSVVMEGVHLSPALAARLAAELHAADVAVAGGGSDPADPRDLSALGAAASKSSSNPSSYGGALVLPFLVDISNEAKHLERFAVRAKAMTLRADANRYVRAAPAIRGIAAHLRAAAAAAGVPVVDNTNVDRSVATIHATVLAVLRRRCAGERAPPLLSGALLEEYERCVGATWSGSSMLELIRLKAARGGGGASPAAAGGAAPPGSWLDDVPSTSAASSARGGGGGGSGGGEGSFFGEEAPTEEEDEGGGGAGGGGEGASVLLGSGGSEAG